jgi:prevent-host-death family protein
MGAASCFPLTDAAKVGNITTSEAGVEKAISAADANRKFSEVLRGVREGQSYVVSSHGKPVARIAPLEERHSTAMGARSALLDRLRSQSVKKIGRWKRDELYE